VDNFDGQQGLAQVLHGLLVDHVAAIGAISAFIAIVDKNETVLGNGFQGEHLVVRRGPTNQELLNHCQIVFQGGFTDHLRHQFDLMIHVFMVGLTEGLPVVGLNEVAVDGQKQNERGQKRQQARVSLHGCRRLHFRLIRSPGALRGYFAGY